MMNAQQMKTNKFLAASMVSSGSRAQFGVAIALITMLPLLTLFYLFHSGPAAGDLPDAAIWAIAIILVGLVCLGYGLLVKYPMTIIHLRQYMESTARGEMPSAVDLPEGESDITAIEQYFNLILTQMKNRIALIQEQQTALTHVERQRVMTESLCTACHHLGQPATALMCYLDLLKTESLSPDGCRHLAGCIGAADKMRNILGELQNITEYRTEPYCAVTEGQEHISLKIIQVQGDRAARSPNVRETLDESFRVGIAALVPS